MKNPEQNLRRAEILLQLDREFLGRGVTDTNRRDFLLDGVNDCSAAHSYIVGAESTFDPVEIADLIARSDRGKIALNVEEKRVELNEVYHRLSKLPPAQRLAEARKMGLA